MLVEAAGIKKIVIACGRTVLHKSIGGPAQYHMLEENLEGLTNANCQACARRDFSDAVKAIKDPNLAKRSTTYQALVRIAAIYKLDESLKELTPQQRLRERQKSVKPLVEEYFTWVKDVLDSQLPKGATAFGLNYSINQEKYLRIFLNDGETPIDNSASEDPSVHSVWERKIIILTIC